MAKKVKCPSCGAKNSADDHRCRVCTAVINPAAAEAVPKHQLKSKTELEAIEEAKAANERSFDAAELQRSMDDAGAPRKPRADEAPIPSPHSIPTAGDTGNGSGPGSIDIAAVPRHQENAQPLFADGAVESFSGHDFGVQIDVVSRHPGDPEPPAPSETDELLNSGNYGIEFTRDQGPTGPPASAAAEADKYVADPTGDINYDDMLSRHPGDPEPPPPQPGEVPWDAEKGGIDIDVMSRHPGDPPPPEERGDDERWDARKGGIEFDPSIWVADNPAESD